MSARRLCDSCKSTPATLFCRADAAFLCNECDTNIHTANKLASRHERVSLCEVCQQAPAHVTCKADAASLCITCDRDIHTANPLSRRHERVPVTPFYDAPGSTISEDNADVSMEAASWLLPNPTVKEGGVEIPSFFSDLKSEVSENSSSGNDGVVPMQNKSLFLNEEYFSFDLSASYKKFPLEFNQTVLSTCIDVALVPEEGATIEVSNATTVAQAVQLSPAEREARVLRYKEKRKNRRFEKTIRYASRKAYAEMRPRIKGRFVRRTDTSVGNGGEVGMYGGFGVVPRF